MGFVKYYLNKFFESILKKIYGGMSMNTQLKRLEQNNTFNDTYKDSLFGWVFIVAIILMIIFTIFIYVISKG